MQICALRLSKNFVFPTICVLASQNTDVRKFPCGNFLPLKVSKPRYTPPVLMRLRSKRFFMRAAARLLFRRENRLYQQTESTDANLCSFCVWDMPAPCLAVAATGKTPCTEWPRTVMRGGLRKLTSGPDSVPKSARRPEPSPRNSRLAAQPKGVAAKGR